jgi:glycosyltransferase involved in cell wall biosynthesis
VRVALVGPYPLDIQRFGGGVEAAFFNLVQGFAVFPDLKIDVVTFVPGATGSRSVVVENANVHYVPGHGRLTNLTLYRRDRRTLRALLDQLRPDVVHAQDALGYGYVCLKCARDEPVVVSIHGIVRETCKQLTSPRARLQASLAGVAVERYCVRHAAFLVEPTPYPEQYFGAEIRGQIVDVGNGIPDRFFAAEAAPDPGRLLFAGGIVHGKRLLDLVEAVARVSEAVPSVSLRVAGPAPDAEYKAQVVARLQALGMEGRVSFLGPLSAEQLIEEYRHAAIVVVPSAQETSPMVIGEAMAVGVPVVATRVGGIPYLVEAGQTGDLVAVGDVAALAAALRQLLLDEDLRAACGARARERALARFRCSDVAARVRQVYLVALGSSANGFDGSGRN